MFLFFLNVISHTKDDGASYSASSSRYSSGLGRENTSISSSLSNRNSLLNDLDSSLGASSTRKKLRSDYDNPTSFDYSSTTQSGSGYGSSRRFESSGALSSTYSRETGSTIRKSYLDDLDDDDFSADKYSPRRLGMLSSGRHQQQQQQSITTRELSSSSAYKKYLDDDDDDNDLSISSSVNKRTRYSKLDDFDDKEDNYSIRSTRKYSSSSNTSYLKDDPEAFYAELTSRTSNRLTNKRNQDDDYNYSKDDDDLRSSSYRYLSKQSTRDDPNKFQLDDDYLSTTSSHSRRQLSRLSSKEETGSTISSKPPSRFLSKYASREQIQDDDDETSKYFASPRKTSRFGSREELNKDDDGRESLLKYKKYSREESNTSVLGEKPLIPENRSEGRRDELRQDKSDLNTFSSLGFKASRMFKDSSQDESIVVTKQQLSTSSTTKTGFFDKENHSKSYSEDDNSVLDAKVSINFRSLFLASILELFFLASILDLSS